MMQFVQITVLILCSVFILSACKPTPQNEHVAQSKSEQVLSSQAADLLQRYERTWNDYLKHHDHLQLQQDLNALLLDIPQISEDYSVLHLKSQILMQLGRFQDALEVNRNLFQLKPSAITYSQECLVQEILKATPNDIQQCYREVVKLNQDALAQLHQDSNEYQDALWLHQLFQYQAGEHQVLGDLQRYVQRQPEALRGNLQLELDMRTQLEVRAELLESIRQNGQF